MAIVVPKNAEAWTSEHRYRVELFDRDEAHVRRVYFEDASSASFFADAHTSRGGFPCSVEDRDMPVTHEVWSLAVDTDYTFWIKRFGDIETATLEFNVGKVHALKHGGRYQLRAVGTERALAEFGRRAD